MATVIFDPLYEEGSQSIGSGKARPVCNKVCGTGACKKARAKGKCPGDTSSQNLVTCVTHRYILNSQVLHADYRGGTMRELDL